MKFTRKAWYFRRLTIYWHVHVDARGNHAWLRVNKQVWSIRLGRVMLAWHKPRAKKQETK